MVCVSELAFLPRRRRLLAALNPLRQKSQSGQFMRLASLDLLPEDGTPRKVAVIADRTDAWNRYPAEPIGAVFLRRSGGDVLALQVICPHAGCSIGFEGDGQERQVLLSLPCGQFRPGRQTDGPNFAQPPRHGHAWRWNFATKTKCGSSFRPSASARPPRWPKDKENIMKTLLAWVNDRTGLGDWCGRMARSPVAGGACWCKVLPCTILFVFCVEAITGFFLWMYYSPSAQTAWESVYFVQNDVLGGWLLRAIHHYGAHVLLALLMLAVVQEILTGAYRAPRELVFWCTVGLGLCAGGHPDRRLALLGPERLRLDQDANRLSHLPAPGGR